jgi:hypothetical protein
VRARESEGGEGGRREGGRERAAGCQCLSPVRPDPRATGLRAPRAFTPTLTLAVTVLISEVRLRLRQPLTLDSRRRLLLRS